MNPTSLPDSRREPGCLRQCTALINFAWHPFPARAATRMHASLIYKVVLCRFSCGKEAGGMVIHQAHAARDALRHRERLCVYPTPLGSARPEHPMPPPRHRYAVGTCSQARHLIHRRAPSKPGADSGIQGIHDAMNGQTMSNTCLSTT